jgi:uncharacterized protein (TIGR02246 family)
MAIKKFFSVFLLSTLLATPVLAASSMNHCVKVTDTTIAQLFDRWNDSLKTADADKVDANYTDNAVLLATLANTPRVTRAQRIAYFKDFLAKHPVGKIDSRTIKIGCNKAIDTGLYTFTMEDGKTLQARYTFTYRWNGHKWLISSHHSSSMPEK